MDELSVFLKDYFVFKKWLKRALVLGFFALSVGVAARVAFNRGQVYALQSLMEMLQQQGSAPAHDDSL